MVHVATFADGFEARLCAAHLGAEGVLWELRGADSLYPVGVVDLLVDEADLGVARDLLDAAVVVDVDTSPPGPAGLTRGDVLLMVGGAAGLASLVAARVVALG
jgi:hypothetical protein